MNRIGKILLIYSVAFILLLGLAAIFFDKPFFYLKYITVGITGLDLAKAQSDFIRGKLAAYGGSLASSVNCKGELAYSENKAIPYIYRMLANVSMYDVTGALEYLDEFDEDLEKLKAILKDDLYPAHTAMREISKIHSILVDSNIETDIEYFKDLLKYGSGIYKVYYPTEKGIAAPHVISPSSSATFPDFSDEKRLASALSPGFYEDILVNILEGMELASVDPDSDNVLSLSARDVFNSLDSKYAASDDENSKYGAYCHFNRALLKYAQIRNEQDLAERVKKFIINDIHPTGHLNVLSPFYKETYACLDILDNFQDEAVYKEKAEEVLGAFLKKSIDGNKCNRFVVSNTREYDDTQTFSLENVANAVYEFSRFKDMRIRKN
ncbi:hypothetical protein HYW61_00155 [candidate division WWE3 bacterium]|nr:hypothetical protein [candidate division WWE3 bacterium]